MISWCWSHNAHNAGFPGVMAFLLFLTNMLLLAVLLLLAFLLLMAFLPLLASLLIMASLFYLVALHTGLCTLYNVNETKSTIGLSTIGLSTIDYRLWLLDYRLSGFFLLSDFQNIEYRIG